MSVPLSPTRKTPATDDSKLEALFANLNQLAYRLSARITTKVIAEDD